MTSLPPTTDADLFIDVFDDQPLPGASFPEAVRRFFRRYACFSGRASRSEYWWVVLFQVVVWASWVVLAGIAAGIGQAVAPATDGGSAPGSVVALIIAAVLYGTYALGIVVPTIALRTRRLHDAGYSGKFQLLLLVPAGELVVFVFTLLPSDPAGRRFDRPLPDDVSAAWDQYS